MQSSAVAGPLPGAERSAVSGGTLPTPGGAGSGAEVISLYEKRQQIYQREVNGPWQRFRAVVLFVLTAVYLVGPWLTWGDVRPAIWFDLPRRRFHLFSVTFWPQDFIFLSWLLIIAALGLFFFTNLAGRLWCGYGCPQTVWTKFYMWIEWLTEGDRMQRMRLDRGPWTGDKVLRKTAKHALWLSIATVVGVTFVGYFVPIRDLLTRIPVGDISRTETVSLFFAVFLLYFDAGWMREQVCLYMCPYARFQGAMFDRSTLTIFYDHFRGEPRGYMKRGVDRGSSGLGDCINCELCVQVCPTGIDIREGTQYECIGCTACIDACDEVMEGIGRPKGLVRYASEESLETGVIRLFRPRTFAYGTVFLVMVALFSWGLARRVPIKLDVLRDQGRLYTETSEGLVENVYTLRLLNMDDFEHSYSIAAEGFEDLTLDAPAEVNVPGGEILDVPVRIQAEPGELKSASTRVVFTLTSTDGKGITVHEKSRFMAPASAVSHSES